jgi:hypothetical protein
MPIIRVCDKAGNVIGAHQEARRLERAWHYGLKEQRK